MEPLMTIKEVARFFNVTPQSVYNWIVEGKLKTCKVPGDPRFNREYIMSLTLKDLNSNEYTPYRCRKLEREVEELREQINYYKQVLAKMDMLMAEVRYEDLKKKNI